MLKEFKEFAIRGNVLDMAIGVIIGGAFGKIVSSLVSDVLMPPLGLLMGKVDFSSLFVGADEDACQTSGAPRRIWLPILSQFNSTAESGIMIAVFISLL
ncbi:MAG: large conductance mechanosensitive channel protein MscL [Nitrospira sp.]|nr:large conductance mechanosensitive channel protein MscL [Nitrospira sp.]